MKKFKDHILQITQTKDIDYYDNLSDEERKSFSPWLIIKYLSFSIDLIPVLGEYLPRLNSLRPGELYKVLIEIIPKGNYSFKSIKRKSIKPVYNTSIIELLIKEYQCSKLQGEEYYDILDEIGELEKTVKELRVKYGLND
jgi:hypothetical protein